MLHGSYAGFGCSSSVVGAGIVRTVISMLLQCDTCSYTMPGYSCYIRLCCRTGSPSRDYANMMILRISLICPGSCSIGYMASNMPRSSIQGRLSEHMSICLYSDEYGDIGYTCSRTPVPVQ